MDTPKRVRKRCHVQLALTLSLAARPRLTVQQRGARCPICPLSREGEKFQTGIPELKPAALQTPSEQKVCSRRQKELVAQIVRRIPPFLCDGSPSFFATSIRQAKSLTAHRRERKELISTGIRQ